MTTGYPRAGNPECEGVAETLVAVVEHLERTPYPAERLQRREGADLGREHTRSVGSLVDRCQRGYVRLPGPGARRLSCFVVAAMAQL